MQIECWSSIPGGLLSVASDRIAFELPTPALLTAYAPNLEAFEFHSELRLGDAVIRFPHAKTGASLEPEDWLNIVSGEENLHEPGLVAWILALGKFLSEKQVRFYDLGAAYGYFTAIANVAFDNADVVAVEPNASLANYIGMLARNNDIDRLQIENILLSDTAGQTEFDVRNFLYFPAGQGRSEGFHRECVSSSTLEAVLADRDEAQEIFKIDTEGWQARFLPPAANLLIEREAIILLEFDAPEKIGLFGATNADVVEPFAEAGYRLFWCDHRDPAFEVIELDGFDPEHERNALVAMLPPDFG